jgi:hypothetical protein
MAFTFVQYPLRIVLILLVLIHVGVFFLAYLYIVSNTKQVTEGVFRARRVLYTYNAISERNNVYATGIGPLITNNNLLQLIPHVDECNHGMPYIVNGKKCCLCPKLTKGDQCDDMLKGGKYFIKFTSCYGHWVGIDAHLKSKSNHWQTVGETTYRIKNYAERYVRWYDGRDTCQSVLNNQVDIFFHNMSLLYGAWTDNDAKVMHTLHRFNQYMFLPSVQGSNPLTFDSPVVPGKILFILMFHHEEELSEYLLRTILSENHYYILTISKQAEKKYWKHMNHVVEQINMPNVMILPYEWSIEGAWSDISLLYMEMIPTMYVLMYGWTDWSHKIALSETHFPAKNIRDLSSFLANQKPERVFSEHEKKPKDRVLTTQIFLDGLCRNLYGLHADLRHLANRSELVPQGGSQWHVVPRNVLMYIFTGRLAIEYMFITKHSAVPDEMYIPTMIRALYYSKTWELTNKEVIKFDKKPVFREKSETLTYLQFWGPRPRYIDKSQFHKVKASGKFFARKIIEIADAKDMAKYFKIEREIP